LAIRTWPKAGCSMASAVIASSMSCGTRFLQHGLLRLISCNASSPPASSPGRCCWPLSLIRCGGPSAIRTRTAAKRRFQSALGPVESSGVALEPISRSAKRLVGRMLLC
jgi:hypothetical protein